MDPALRGAEGCARRPRCSQSQLAGRLPLVCGAAAVPAPEIEDELDAFMKRFVGGEDIRALSRREVSEPMERLGVIPSAARFRTLVAIRNRLAHVYPDQPERQARNLADAYDAIGELLSLHEQPSRYLRHRAGQP